MPALPTDNPKLAHDIFRMVRATQEYLAIVTSKPLLFNDEQLKEFYEQQPTDDIYIEELAKLYEIKLDDEVGDSRTLAELIDLARELQPAT
jgi:hypothetical protein